MTAHRLPDVTVVADAGMISEENQKAIEAARLSFILGYQHKADRARRTLRGIDEQVAKAAKAVAGLAPVKRNWFIRLDGTAKSVNRELEARARALAGLRGYVTNLATRPDGTPVTPAS